MEEGLKRASFPAFFRSSAVFSPGKIDERTVRYLLRSAISSSQFKTAPELAFVIVQNSKILNALEQRMVESLTHSGKLQAMPGSGYNPFSGSKTLVVICGKNASEAARESCYWLGQNLVFTANAMGLASHPVPFAEYLTLDPFVLSELEIPPHLFPILPLMIGFDGAGKERVLHYPLEIVSWCK